MKDLKKIELAIPVEELTPIIETTIDSYIKMLPEKIYGMLNASIARCLGFSDRWTSVDGWEIDNCNGRESTVASYCNSKAKKTVEDSIEEIGNNFVLEKSMKLSLQKEFKNLVEQNLRKAIKEKAEEFTNKLIADMVPEVIDMRKPSLQDLANPEYGSNLIQEILIDEIFRGAQVADR